MRSDRLIVSELWGIILPQCTQGDYGLAPSLVLLLVPYNKQLNNLDRLVIMGKSQTLATEMTPLSLGQYGKASV